MKVQELMGVLFASRDFAHKAHLNTESYAEHVALGGFYDDIIDAADAFAEAWQGRNGKRIGNIPSYDSMSSGKPAVILKRYLKEVEDCCEECCKDDSALQNLFDNIVAVYLSTIYKLTFLK